MKVSCNGRKVDLKENFETRVEKRFNKLDKFFNEDAQAHVTVSVEKNYQKVEITVRESSGFVVRAEKSAASMEEAFEAAANVLTQNIVKNRKKIADKLQRVVPALDETETYNEDEEEEDYHLIREKHFVVKPCSVDEAILQMNMLGHSFYLFRDADSDEINLVYSRKDGSYGLLIPER